MSISSYNCSLANIFNLIKKLIHFCLFLAFLILTILGLINLLSEETTFLVSTRIPSNVTLPSFTICPHASNETFLDKKLLAKNLLSKRILPFPINVSAWMQSRMDGQYTTFDLLSEEVLKNKFKASFHEIWDFHCKIYPPSTNLDSCTPCLTFRNPTFEGQFEFGLIIIAINKYDNHEYEESDFLKRIKSFTIQLHERDQSFALKKFNEWGHSVFVSFEENKTIEVNKLLQLTEKEVILSPNAKCKDDKNYKPDREMTSLITTKIKCNLPWSNLQMDHFEDCKTEEEFENYLKEIIEEQEAIEQIAKKCRYKIWTLTHWGKVSRDGNTGNTSLTIDLLSTRGQVNIEKQVYVYTLEYFIGVLGGYLGLFLGGSILGFIELIENFACIMYTSWKIQKI